MKNITPKKIMRFAIFFESLAFIMSIIGIMTSLFYPIWRTKLSFFLSILVISGLFLPWKSFYYVFLGFRLFYKNPMNEPKSIIAAVYGLKNKTGWTLKASKEFFYQWNRPVLAFFRLHTPHRDLNEDKQDIRFRIFNWCSMRVYHFREGFSTRLQHRLDGWADRYYVDFEERPASVTSFDTNSIYNPDNIFNIHVHGNNIEVSGYTQLGMALNAIHRYLISYGISDDEAYALLLRPEKLACDKAAQIHLKSALPKYHKLTMPALLTKKIVNDLRSNAALVN